MFRRNMRVFIMKIIFNNAGLQNKVIQAFIDIYSIFPKDSDFYNIEYNKTHILDTYDEKELYSFASSELKRLKSLGRAELYVFLDSVVLKKESSITAVSMLDYNGVESFGINKATKDKMPSISDPEFIDNLDKLKTSIFIDAFCESMRDLMKKL